MVGIVIELHVIKVSLKYLFSGIMIHFWDSTSAVEIKYFLCRFRWGILYACFVFPVSSVPASLLEGVERWDGECFLVC